MRFMTLLLTLAAASVGCSNDLSVGCSGPEDCPSDYFCHSRSRLCLTLPKGDAAPGADAAPSADADQPEIDAASSADADQPELEATVDARVSPDACVPSEEICNGVDDDCDGEIDETDPALGASCVPDARGVCASEGVKICTPAGALVCSATRLPEPERCDEQDNDCDGAIDEDLSVACYYGPPATSGVGACVRGTVSCGSTECAGQVVPSIEVCNGVDDNCNGETDEGTTEACGIEGIGVCRGGTRACASDGPCVGEITPAAQDGCDGLDNDCDDAADEDCECVTGEPCAGSEIGICTPGFQDCVEGVFASCFDRVEPRDEVCNGLDDDCDGEADEGVPCYDGSPATTKGVGQCRGGTRDCDTGICEGETRPQAEVCNALDDDCDGEADEDFSLAVACADGVGICASSGFTQCAPDGAEVVCGAQPGQPRQEQCNNSLDDDCDGSTDEECECQPGFGRRCGSDTGECRWGWQTCVGGNWGPCEGGQGPVAEVCNWLDDDCDGVVDDEVFDAEDVCQAACGPGSWVCIDGHAECVANVNGRPELCNGLDDDCDGQVDEGFPVGQRCTVGAGECFAEGRYVCLDDGAACNVTPGQPEREVCNGRDDDCDGQVDEDPSHDCGVDRTGAARQACCRLGAPACAFECRTQIHVGEL